MYVLSIAYWALALLALAGTLIAGFDSLAPTPIVILVMEFAFVLITIFAAHEAGTSKPERSIGSKLLLLAPVIFFFAALFLQLSSPGHNY